LLSMTKSRTDAQTKHTHLRGWVVSQSVLTATIIYTLNPERWIKVIHIRCPRCRGKGLFKSGLLAKVKAKWNCPRCGGTGKLALSLQDRVLLLIAVRLKKVLHKYTSTGV